MLWLLFFVALALLLAYQRATLVIWSISLTIALILLSRFSNLSHFTLFIYWIIFLAGIIVLNIKPIRRLIISRHILAFFRAHAPKMSITEREALQAGSVGFEGQLFSGKPNWRDLHLIKAAQLTDEEREFLNGPLRTLCQMANDWEITHVYADLPPALWQYIKDQGFWGLIIPKQYGGKEFSTYAHSEVIATLSSISATLATIVSVPNSLGPAELLIKYGTQSQRDYYLPRLARGNEIPCFALTGIRSGSDASNMSDIGIVCKGEFEGKEIIGIRVNWNKRYITLAPVATVIGLAFKLYDPQHLIGDTTDIGITCALIPATTKGVVHGRRHFPLNNPFQNGPTQGHDVFIPFDMVIGGQSMIGQGWRMLVECLSVGRAVSLPAIATGGAKMGTLTTSAYARIREQFNLPIGYFEGISEKLSRMGGFIYLMDAARLLTLAAIDAGEEPAIASAILKYHLTEFGRLIGLDAMDVHGGKGICLGPNNHIGRDYHGLQIAITVEGANILTRSMIIFGQGAIRAHPYVLREIESVQFDDVQKGLRQFDDVIFKHIGLIISNFVRTFLLGLTNGRLAFAHKNLAQRYYQQMTRFSAAFAFLADMCMIFFGAQLKRMESTSARLGDILSMLYIGSAVLRRYQLAKEPVEELPLFNWSCQYILMTIERRMNAILANYPYRWVALVLRIFIFPLGRSCHGPNDKLGLEVTKLLLKPSETRTRLCAGVYTGTRQVGTNPVELLERTLNAVVAVSDIEARIRRAINEKRLNHVDDLRAQYELAFNTQIITDNEYQQLLMADDLRLQVIKVDDFDSAELANNRSIN